MKTNKILALLTALLFCTAGWAQQIANEKIPAGVKSTFANKFPSATDLKWVKEPNGNYEAKFMVDKSRQRAEFDKKGNWVETENVLSTANVPKTVSDAVMKENPSCKIADAEEIQTADKGKVYEVGCKTEAGKKDYRVSPDGKLEARLEKKK